MNSYKEDQLKCKVDYITLRMKKDKLNMPTIKFFIHLESFMNVSYPFTTTTAKLANSYDKSERSIRRYTHTLVLNGYLLKKKNWDYSDPEKPVHVSSTYTYTNKCSSMISAAEEEFNRMKNINKNVYFMKETQQV